MYAKTNSCTAQNIFSDDDFVIAADSSKSTAGLTGRRHLPPARWGLALEGNVCENKFRAHVKAHNLTTRFGLAA